MDLNERPPKSSSPARRALGHPVSGVRIALRRAAAGWRVALALGVGFVVIEGAGFVWSRLTSGVVAVERGGMNFPAATFPADRILRLATYNICKGKGDEANTRPLRRRGEMEARLDAISDLLRSEGADIVVLNELDFDSMPTGRRNQARRIAERAGFPFFAEGRDIFARTVFLFSEQSGNAVLSRYPIRSAVQVPLPGFVWWETLLGGRRNGLLCEIDLGEGGRIHLLAVHLESRSESVRRASVEIIDAVRRELGQRPFLVAGDLNSSPRDSLESPREETAISRLYASRAFATRPVGPIRNSDTTLSFRREPYVIDWIFVPRDWEILDKRVIRSPASDHWPVFLAVRVPEQDEEGPAGASTSRRPGSRSNGQPAAREGPNAAQSFARGRLSNASSLAALRNSQQFVH